MANGAPAALISAATRAMADEIAHARAATGIACAIDGQPRGYGPLEVTGSLEDASPAALLRDTLIEGCIGETIASAIAHASSEECTEPTIRSALARICADEQRHALLAWRTVRWLLDTHPELRAEAVALLASHRLGQRPADSPGVPALGMLSARQQHAIAESVLKDVIAPCAHALLQTTPTVADHSSQMQPDA